MEPFPEFEDYEEDDYSEDGALAPDPELDYRKNCESEIEFEDAIFIA